MLLCHLELRKKMATPRIPSKTFPHHTSLSTRGMALLQFLRPLVSLVWQAVQSPFVFSPWGHSWAPRQGTKTVFSVLTYPTGKRSLKRGMYSLQSPDHNINIYLYFINAFVVWRKKQWIWDLSVRLNPPPLFGKSIFLLLSFQIHVLCSKKLRGWGLTANWLLLAGLCKKQVSCCTENTL